MLRNCIVLVLIGLMCNSIMASASFETSTNSTSITDDSASKVKKTVSKIGTGKKAKVTVQLLDDKKVKGYISFMENDLFTVTDDSGLDTKIRYDQVKFINRRGLGIGSWIVIGALGTAAAFVVVVFIASKCQYGC